MRKILLIVSIVLGGVVLAACSNNVDFIPPPGSTEIAITHYSFGKMIIDGQSHNGDLAILPEGKLHGWSFDYDSHEIIPENFKALITDEVKIVIIGTGYNGAAFLAAKAKEFVELIRAKGIQIHIMPTRNAVKLFNSTSKKGLLACFHLNC